MSNEKKHVSASVSFRQILDKYMSFKVDIMSEYQLSPAQWDFIEFIFFERWELFFKYCEETNGKYFTSDLINDLYEKGITKNRWNRNRDDHPDQVLLRDDFYDDMSYKIYGKSSEEISREKRFAESMGLEFLRTYPDVISWYNNNGSIKKVSAKAVKNFTYKGHRYGSKDDIPHVYVNLIKYNEDLHRDIIKRLEIAKRKNGEDNIGDKVPQIKVKIENFLINKSWEEQSFIDNTNDDTRNSKVW